MKPIIERLLEAKIIDKDESGFYNFWTTLGYLTPMGLRTVADAIDKINLPWTMQIQHMYDSYLRVCSDCSKDREILTLGIMLSAPYQCQMCGNMCDGHPNLIHNPNCCEPPHETT